MRAHRREGESIEEMEKRHKEEGEAMDKKLGRDKAMDAVTPAAMDGPLMTDPGRIVLRWLSVSNFELVYRGHVFLLDAYFERGPRNRPTGIVPAEVTRTDAIFIGHAHFDHMSDAAPIAPGPGPWWSARRSPSRPLESSDWRRSRVPR